MALKEILIESVDNGYMVTVKQEWEYKLRPETNRYVYASFRSLVFALAGWLLKSLKGRDELDKLLEGWEKDNG